MYSQRTGIFKTAILIFVLLLVVAPVLTVLYNLFNPLIVQGFSSDSFFIEARIYHLFARSLYLSFAVLTCCTILAIPIAWIFSKYSFPFKGTIFLLTTIPLFIPPYISAISWMYAFDSEAWFGFPDSFNFISGFGGNLLVFSFWLFPLMVLFFYNALLIGKPYFEVVSLHHTWWPRFRFNVILMAKYGVVPGMILTFVLVFVNFSVPGVLQLNVYPTEIFAQFGAFYDQEQAALLSLPNLIIAIFLAVYISKHFNRQKRFGLLNHLPGFKTISGAKLRGVYIFFILFIAVVIGIPILALILRSESFSVFFQAFADTFVQWTNSLLFAFVGTLIICATAFFLVWHVRHKPGLQMLTMAILLLPIFVSGGLYAIGLIQVWNQPFLGGFIYGSSLMVIFSYFRFMPIAFFLLLIGISKLPGQFEEIAILSNRSEKSFIAKIILPQVKNSFSIAFSIIFIFCFTELDTVVLIYPPGMETIPVRIFALLHYGTHQTVAALCLWQIIFIIGILLPFSGLINKKLFK